MSKPQQREVARSERGEVDPQARRVTREQDDAGDQGGRTGKVPPANRPGHRPARDQDKPRRPDRPAPR